MPLTDAVKRELGLEDKPPAVYHITAPSLTFAVWVPGEGFGQVIVDVDPGQRKTLHVNGHLVTVIRDYVH